MGELRLHQLLMAEGRAEGYAQGLVEGYLTALLRMGLRRFGSVSPAVLTRLGTVTDPAELDRRIARVFDVSGWDELLDL